MAFEPHTHGPCPEGLECLCTFEDITEENFVEYQTHPSMAWHCAKYSSDVIRQLLNTQFSKYLDDVEKATRDCAAAVRRLVSVGPPVTISDKHGLPLPEGDTSVVALWFADEGTERDAKLTGALEGEERELLWRTQKEVLASMEAAEAASKAEKT